MGEVLRDIQGNIPFTQIFRPIPENKIITIIDQHGYEWKKFTVTGYIRCLDSFFWPTHPNSSFNGIFAPTIENKKIKN